MDVISAYRDVGTYRGAAAICGTTHKTVKRVIEAHNAASDSTGVGAGPPVAPKAPRARNYDGHDSRPSLAEGEGSAKNQPPNQNHQN